MMDRGCGSVGWAVASNTLGPRFDSKSSAKFILSNAYCQLYWKDENKEKRGRECDNLKSIIMMTIGIVEVNEKSFRRTKQDKSNPRRSNTRELAKAQQL